MRDFEFDGKKYQKASAHQKEWGRRMISDLPLKGSESVLDLGCGDGVLTKLLSDMVPEGNVLGIDSSVRMIQTAKELESGNLSFLCMDINDMAFNDEFDLIFSNATLHWVKDHDSLLGKCRKALRKNGMIRFSLAGKGNSGTFCDVTREVISRSIYKGFFAEFEWPWYMPELAEYEELVRRHEFKDLVVWEEKTDRYFGTQDEMVRWIDQPVIIPFVRVVPEAQKSEFRDTVVEGMIRETVQPDGRFFEMFNRINVFAIK